jgi:uncharacterized integral membrane protein
MLSCSGVAALPRPKRFHTPKTHARRTRLHLATGAVPGVLWLVLVCGAVLTVGFTFFFGTKNLPAQVMMTGILSVLVFMGLLVIVAIDHPFTGPVHVGSEPLKTVVEDFAHAARAFSSEVDADSRQENAIKQRSRATF